MRNHLFIDSLNALASDLQTNVFHILTRTRKVSDKMDTLAIHLLQFKTSLYQNMAQFITQSQEAVSTKNTTLIAQALDGLREEITASNDRLCRYKLHHILKNKADKKRRESMLASSLSVQQEEALTDLEKSIVMIEKDLGIETENEENQKLAITRIINRSLFLGLDSTPISKIKGNDYSVISEAGSVDIDLTSRDISQDLSHSIVKQNMQENGKQYESEQKLPAVVKKVNPLKKKKTNLPKTEAKEGLLGNLLEQTYNQCLDKV